ncbi:MAG: class I SAM-dependent methyltransferase [Acidobacteriota bacterium]
MAAATSATQADYGLLAPRAVHDMYSRAAWTAGFALVLYFINRAEYPGPSARLAGVLLLVAGGFFAAARFLVWVSKTGSLRVREQLLDALELNGSERILDVGCGRGILGIGAAQRLKTGKVIGVAGESEIARENAKAEGVADRIRFEPGEFLKLSYPDANFDAVICGLALHTLEHADERSRAVREMVRVLKPGGRLAIHEIGDISEYSDQLTAAKLNVEVAATSLPLGLGGRIIVARK